MTGHRFTGFGRSRELKSFLGVRFGDSIDDAMHRYPSGSVETSPYGAPAYRIENEQSGSVAYQNVVYEFNDAGMQLAIAHFTPASSSYVLQQLKQSLGEPTSSGGTDPADASTMKVSWALTGGGSVDFSGPAHRLTLLGPRGDNLKQDVTLREAGDSE
jgi:hypothetical protein